MATIDPKLKELIDSVTAKRPRVVLDHILKDGHITTEELGAYGYNHPPRAARDVREQGIPLVTFRVRASDGRSIGAYRLGDPGAVKGHKLGGRSVLPSELRDFLYDRGGRRCFVCGHGYEKRYLQIDHRLPYEIGGESADPSDSGAFMLLCASCQRSKSWSCEHCPNWSEQDAAACVGCYWVDPADHTHVATAAVRRLDVVFVDEEVAVYDALSARARREGRSLAEAVRELVRSARASER
jgi:hypothetical protein